MDKKKKININSQTQSQDTYYFDSEQKATEATEDLFTKDDLLSFPDKTVLTDKRDEKSSKGKKHL